MVEGVHFQTVWHGQFGIFVLSGGLIQVTPPLFSLQLLSELPFVQFSHNTGYIWVRSSASSQRRGSEEEYCTRGV